MSDMMTKDEWQACFREGQARGETWDQTWERLNQELAAEDLRKTEAILALLETDRLKVRKVELEMEPDGYWYVLDGASIGTDGAMYFHGDSDFYYPPEEIAKRLATKLASMNLPLERE